MYLITDPDLEVFQSVSERIESYGRSIIPNLEQLWENTPDGEVQEKIESLIHRLHFRELQSEFSTFAQSTRHDLLEGAMLVARYLYPDMADNTVLQDIEKIKRNIWLELNNYLTGLEQINIVNRILFNYYKFKGVEIAYQHPEEFLINKVLETKRGNSIINGILYQLLCSRLDIPVKAIRIPHQFLLAYFDTSYEYFNAPKNDLNIHFYIDPLNGHVYTQKDVENYFKNTGIPLSTSYFKPMEHKQIFRFLLEELAKCFSFGDHRYKSEELLSLVDIMKYSNNIG